MCAIIGEQFVRIMFEITQFLVHSKEEEKKLHTRTPTKQYLFLNAEHIAELSEFVTRNQSSQVSRYR